MALSHSIRTGYQDIALLLDGLLVLQLGLVALLLDGLVAPKTQNS